MASVNGYMGKGLSGSSCSPAQSPNPANNYGEPFGHAHQSDLDDLLNHCTCSIYDACTSFNITSLNCCHEIVLVYYRVVGDVDGRTYRVKNILTKGSTTVFDQYFDFIWDDAWSYYNGYIFYGWTPCFMQNGGSDYNSTWGNEINENGTDWKHTIELWDQVTSTKVASWDQTFTVSGLTHTVMTGTIQNYAGENVKGDIRIRCEHTLAAGACADGIGGTGEVYQNRALDDDYTYSINVDGMEGNVRITPYKAGYQKKEIEFSGITAKDLNTGNDFTGANYLPSTAYGIVHDTDGNVVSDANVWANETTYGTKYGCKTASDGKYALPIHTGGSYSVHCMKNNHQKIDHVTYAQQSGYHPSTLYNLNFTVGVLRLARVTAYPVGNYAHLNVLCVDDQSVVILDDPVTSSALIKPLAVGASIVKVKTRKWGTGAAQCTTSTGTSNGGIGYGSGGSNYDGNTGDAESWE